MSTRFQLRVAHEWLAHDPFGRPKPSDVPIGGILDAPGILSAARNSYLSFRVLISGEGAYRLTTTADRPLEVDLYQAWYHHLPGYKGEPTTYLPDALIPVRDGQNFRLPDPDAGIAGQIVQEFWVDVFVPMDAEPGRAEVRLHLEAGSESSAAVVQMQVASVAVPERPCITMDHNSYGARWLATQFPNTFSTVVDPAQRADLEIAYLQHYYRLFHEHRGLFHNLGYGHSGHFDPIYGPRAIGRARTRTLTDWDLFDRHFGPLLDGSAFADPAPGMPRPRRQPLPVWGIYTPLSPEWPASYLWWGEPGYEVEFSRGVQQFDAHLRQRGWTHSKIEFFFNHKKRYRWFEWDGDEVKYLKDMPYHHHMVSMWERAIEGSPVPWIYRLDASWQMAAQFDIMATHRCFWVCGGFHRWYREHVERVIGRGDTVWWYGGSPPVQAATSSILTNLYETWGRGLHGYCAWLTVDPGPDPWFACDGASTGLLYPGERFGIAGPLPSIRLKVQRNAIQDIDLLEQAIASGELPPSVRGALQSQIPLPLWTRPPRVALELPPEDWDSRNLEEEHEPEHHLEPRLHPAWWRVIRDRVQTLGR